LIASTGPGQASQPATVGRQSALTLRWPMAHSIRFESCRRMAGKAADRLRRTRRQCWVWMVCRRGGEQQAGRDLLRVVGLAWRAWRRRWLLMRRRWIDARRARRWRRSFVLHFTSLYSKQVYRCCVSPLVDDAPAYASPAKKHLPPAFNLQDDLSAPVRAVSCFAGQHDAPTFRATV
jgi:hypothetical protein